MGHNSPSLRGTDGPSPSIMAVDGKKIARGRESIDFSAATSSEFLRKNIFPLYAVSAAENDGCKAIWNSNVFTVVGAQTLGQNLGQGSKSCHAHDRGFIGGLFHLQHDTQMCFHELNLFILFTCFFAMRVSRVLRNKIRKLTTPF